MRVAVLRPAHADAEADAACGWVERRGWDLVGVDAALSGLPDGTDVVWCHAGAQVPVLDPRGEAFLSAYVRGGGTVVLSLLAATLGVRLGGVGDGPSRVEVRRPWRNDDDPQWSEAFRDWPGYPHIRGFQGWGPHPLLHALQGGTFSWTATEGEEVSRAVYVRPDWPDARVIAVDRSYVHLDADTAVAWEHEVGAGRITCLGAHVALCAANTSLAAQRDVILLNALFQPSGTPRVGWPSAEKRHAAVAPSPRLRSIGATGEEPSVEAIIQSPPVPSPVTLGGQGGLLVGSMSDGVQEVWLHSLCVLGGGISVAGPSSLTTTSATASAVHLARTLRDSSGSLWREAAFVHGTAPEFVYVLSAVDPPTPRPPDPPTIGVEFRMPLRR
ncbi:MAG: hypothetical protein H7066_06300, partial [Cytophagaceae bacterium]|nr:hypothetical protein [Gemmatimonadaceae bacterium]